MRNSSLCWKSGDGGRDEGNRLYNAVSVYDGRGKRDISGKF